MRTLRQHSTTEIKAKRKDNYMLKSIHDA